MIPSLQQHKIGQQTHMQNSTPVQISTNTVAQNMVHATNPEPNYQNHQQDLQIKVDLHAEQRRNFSGLQYMPRTKQTCILRERREKSYVMQQDIDEQQQQYQDIEIDDEEEYQPRSNLRKNKPNKKQKQKQKPTTTSTTRLLTQYVTRVNNNHKESVIRQQKFQKEQKQMIDKDNAQEQVRMFQYQGHIITEPFGTFQIIRIPNLLTETKQQLTAAERLEIMKKNIVIHKDKQIANERMKMLPKSMRVSHDIYFTKFLEDFDCTLRKVQDKVHEQQQCYIFNKVEQNHVSCDHLVRNFIENKGFVLGQQEQPTFKNLFHSIYKNTINIHRNTNSNSLPGFQVREQSQTFPFSSSSTFQSTAWRNLRTQNKPQSETTRNPVIAYKECDSAMDEQIPMPMQGGQSQEI